MPDNDNYPNEADEKKITEWDCASRENRLALMAFVRELWWMPDWGWSEADTTEGKRIYTISTGGWSGNESLIYALKNNHIFWSLCWVQSRRGGHYIFEV